MVLAAKILAQALDHYGLGRASWSPEPLHGDIYIGDVGYIDEDGAFHRLFNVTVDRDHPVNSGGVPKNFEPLQFAPRLLTVRPNYFPAQPFVSRSVKNQKIEGRADAHGGSIVGGGVAYKFECSNSQCGMLILHDDATKTMIEHAAHIVRYITQNHSSWHAFATDPRRLGVQREPEEIIMVRGTLKTSSWTVAVLKGPTNQTHSFSLSCSVGSATSTNVQASSDENLESSLQYRSGPHRHALVRPSVGVTTSSPSPQTYKYELPEVEAASTSFAEYDTVKAKDQTVFLSYYKVKRRPILPKRIVANAGPNELPRREDPASDVMIVGQSEDIVTVDHSPSKSCLAVDHLLDYILRTSDAEIAIASDDEFHDLFKGRSIPENLDEWLTQNKPATVVDEKRVGMLFVSGVDPGVRGFEESGPGVELNSNDTAATTFEEDSALKVSAFFKSQFHALWKQSVDHIRSRRPQTGGDLNYRYCVALAHYEGSVSDTPHESARCQLQLGPPDFRFSCQHEAAFELNIIKSTFTSGNSHSFNPSRHHSIPAVQEVSDIRVTFSVPFRMTGAVGNSRGRGDGRSTMQFRLDLQHARIVRVSHQMEKGREAFEEYLQAYLCFLQRAGHDTLLYPIMLPYETQPALIDFSRSSSELSSATHVQGVPVEEINRFLAISWLVASTAPSIQSESEVGEKAALPLAECRGLWSSDGEEVHFNLVFGPPHAVALCDSEVILTFDVSEARCYETGNFESNPFKILPGGKIAVLMNVEGETQDAGYVVKGEANRLISHFMPQFSQFESSLESDEEATRFRDRIIDFVSGEYLYILESSGNLIVYHRDLRLPSPNDPLQRLAPDPSSSIPAPNNDRVGPAVTTAKQGGTLSNAITWQELSQTIDMRGFDHVTALSQTAVNDRFRSRWLRSQSGASDDKSLAKWQFKGVFHAAFGPLMIQLLSRKRAILFVAVVEGSLQLVRSSQAKIVNSYQFSDWLVAFDVDLKFCDHAAMPGVGPEWRSTIVQARSSCLSDGTDFDIKHLYLDLQHAGFNLRYSRFKDLNETHLIDKAQAVVIYLRDHYFKRLAFVGHHIISTVLTCRTSADALSRHATSTTFHVDSEQSPYHPAFEEPSEAEPVIFILGTNGDRPLPDHTPERWGHWVTTTPYLAHGTLALSADAFLRGKLLPLLSEVNAMTRIEPTFSEFQHTKWKLYLVTWANHSKHVLDDCLFVPVPRSGTASPLQYHWKLGRKFSTGPNDSHSIYCQTDNHLELPTTPSSGGLVISLYGSISLQLATKDWNSKAHAHWKTTLTLHFGEGQLHATTHTSPTEFTTTESIGRPYSTTPLDPRKLLRQVLPEAVELPSIAEGLEILQKAIKPCSTGQSDCDLMSPVFNSHGDLLVQIFPCADLPSSEVQEKTSNPKSTLTENSDAPKMPGSSRGQRQLEGNSTRKTQWAAGHVPQSIREDEEDSPDEYPYSSISNPTPISGQRFGSSHQHMRHDDPLDTPATSVSPNPKSAVPMTPFASVTVSPMSSDPRSIFAKPTATNDVTYLSRPLAFSDSTFAGGSTSAVPQSVSTTSTTATAVHQGTSSTRRRQSPSPPPLIIPVQPRYKSPPRQGVVHSEAAPMLLLEASRDTPQRRGSSSTVLRNGVPERKSALETIVQRESVSLQDINSKAGRQQLRQQLRASTAAAGAKTNFDGAASTVDTGVGARQK